MIISLAYATGLRNLRGFSPDLFRNADSTCGGNEAGLMRGGARRAAMFTASPPCGILILKSIDLFETKEGSEDDDAA